MATVKFYFDKRTARADGTYPVRLAISHRSSTRTMATGVALRPDEWDERTSKVVNRKDKAFLNNFLASRRNEVERLLLEFSADGTLFALSASELVQTINDTLTPGKARTPKGKGLIADYFQRFGENHAALRTREIYKATLTHIRRFVGDDSLQRLRFEDITKQWLADFDRYLTQTSPSRNARNIHLRNIRAVFNDAIDNDITTAYPFRKFSITPEQTLHRALSVEQLRTLFSLDVQPFQRRYVDMFKLMFFLIGINIVDLSNLREVVNGRVEYKRAKTHKAYSIKVEPEAQEIIDKYKGTTALLNIADKFVYKRFMVQINKQLQRVGGGMFPGLTTYWARHTWATIASELDIPDDVISRALGHSGATGARVTEVYINFNRKKIDEANRKVIDYVLYDRRG